MSAVANGLDILTELRRERDRQGLSKAALARRMGGKSRSSFSMMEDGLKVPTFLTLLSWASALGFEIRLQKKTETMENPHA